MLLDGLNGSQVNANVARLGECRLLYAVMVKRGRRFESHYGYLGRTFCTLEQCTRCTRSSVFSSGHGKAFKILPCVASGGVFQSKCNDVFFLGRRRVSCGKGRNSRGSI